jgi:hypothetical protein
VALCAFCVSAPLAALDLADGRVRLVLHEGIGRFSMSCQTRGSSGVFVPLLAAQDPRTSGLSVVVGNKIYRMGEASEFSEKSEKTPTGGRFLWTSSFLQVSETFTFIASTGSSVSSGVRIDIGVRNLSEKDIAVGVRLLFDTYLGESSFVHFRTDTLSSVTKELSLTAADKSPWWASPLSGDPDNFGLQVMSSGPGITVPDKVVFANWKRLSDASWSYDTSAVRNFSQLPYSVNDSAVSQYYEPRTIPRAGEATVTLAMGLLTKEGFIGTAAPSAAAAAVATTAVTSLDPETARAAAADLASVEKILAQIDAALLAEKPLSADALASIEAALKTLQAASSRYRPPSGK